MNKYKYRIIVNHRRFTIYFRHDFMTVSRRIMEAMEKGVLGFTDDKGRNHIYNVESVRKVTVLPISAKNDGKKEKGKRSPKLRKNRVLFNLIPFCGKLRYDRYNTENMNKINNYYAGLPLVRKG